MNANLSVKYSTRSLVRGGQRTLLALFCIAVGIMAVVGLELAAKSMLAALTGNARALNQGDVSVESASAPVAPADLSYFDQLKAQGTISAYSPQTTSNAIIQQRSTSHLFVTRMVDPATFPLVGPPHVLEPSNASLRSLLEQPAGAVLT